MTNKDSSDRYKRLKIVSVGGGSGQSITLRAVKYLTDQVSAIVTMFDSGGSSGQLRREFGYLPFGDVRQCLLALANTDDSNRRMIAEFMRYRFATESSLRGHALGNLLLAALTEHQGLEYAINELSMMLQVKGRVLPVTFENTELVADLQDGTSIEGEAQIDQRKSSSPKISSVHLNHKIQVNPAVIEAIRAADLLILGPGDLYTSIIPNFLPLGVREVLQSPQIPVVCYVSNLMTKFGETDDYKVSDFARELCKYMGLEKLDYVLADNTHFPEGVLKHYEAENARPIEVDEEELKRYSRNVITANFAQVERERQVIRHSQLQLSATLAQLADKILSTLPDPG